MQLRDLRLAKPMTLRELAAESGVSLATITNIEAGRHLPTPKTTRKLAQVLGVAAMEIDEARAWRDRFIK